MSLAMRWTTVALNCQSGAPFLLRDTKRKRRQYFIKLVESRGSGVIALGREKTMVGLAAIPGERKHPRSY